MKFITDTHLAKLSKYLRLLGFDTAHFKKGSDEELLEIAKEQERIILTRDRELCEKERRAAFFINSLEVDEQLKEILEKFGLSGECRPFSRCLLCNCMVERIDKESVIERLPEKVKEFNDRFWQCRNCKKIYWHGSHYDRMESRIRKFCKK